MNDIHSGNTVFYSTASSGYALYAATSLLTIRDQVPSAKLFILSSGLTPHERKVLDKFSIFYHEIDLRDSFTQTWDYPIDCYYIFAGPEFFEKQGYDYSVYIDGDILCVRNPLQGLPKIKGVAGAASIGENGDYSIIFGNDWAKIKQIWSLPKEMSKRQRINSGIVYFNNRKMKEIKLLNKAIMLFKESIKHQIPRKGDDSLFSLLQYVELSESDVCILPSKYNFVLQYNKWRYPIKDLIFFHFSVDKPWKMHPYTHEEYSLSMFNPLIKMWRKKLRKVDPSKYIMTENKVLLSVFVLYRIFQGYLFNVRRLLKDLAYWSRGYKKSYITRKRNMKKPPINLYWWSDYINGISNFGDEVTKDLIIRIYGYRTVSSSPADAELVGAGSVLEIVSLQHGDNRPYIWGSGFMWEQEDKSGRLEGLKFCAVRGKKSRNRLGKEWGDVTLGDPGLLASIVFKRSSHNSGKVGVIAHFIDSNEKVVKKLKNDPRFMIINPLSSPEEVSLRISSCRLILSSSLHGLVFADSFNVPNKHVHFSNKVAGGNYKFEDYFSATGREYSHADISKIFDNTYLSKLEDEYKPVVNLKKIQKQLVKSLPKLR